MKIKLVLTEDHITLIKNFVFERISDKHYGIDSFGLWGGTNIYEQMAGFLGWSDKVIPETIESVFGPRYEDEYQLKLEEYDAFILENLVYIEQILHQFCDKGGIKPGVYTCLDNVCIWTYEGV